MTDPSTLSTAITIDYRIILAIVQGLTIVIFSGAAWVVNYVLNNLREANKAIKQEVKELKENHAKEIKEIREKLEKAEDETNSINVNLPSQYVTKLEFSRMVDALFGRFDKVMEKMDNNKKDTDTKFDNVIEKINNVKNGSE